MKLRVIGLALSIVCGCTVACSSEPSADAGPDAATLDAGSEDASGPDATAPDASDGGPSRERCDEPGEVCCADGSCAGDLPCVEGLCGFIGCGDLGEPCCGSLGGGRGACHLLSGAICEDGTCVEPHCGSEGYECCADDPACREDFVCHEGSCLRCGDLGEQCCPGGICDGDFYCQGEPGTLGQCIAEAPPCGGEGEACCPEGAICDPGLGCVTDAWGFSGLCLAGPACGTDGRPCCDTDPSCGAGHLCVTESDGVDRCRRCGGYELACCDGATPCGPGLTCGVGGTCVLPPP